MTSGYVFAGGVPEKIRTSDPTLRRRVLYPAELRRHYFIIISQFLQICKKNFYCRIEIKQYIICVLALKRKL